MFRHPSLSKGRRTSNRAKSNRNPFTCRFEQLEDRRVLTTFVNGLDAIPDGGGCGSFANPCDTIESGIANAPAGGEVYIAGGLYNETVAITKNIHLRGEAGAVTVDGIVNGFDITGPVNVKLEDILVTASAIGIRAVGIGSLELEDVTALANTTDGVTVMGASSVIIDGGNYNGNGLNGITLDSITGAVWVVDSTNTNGNGVNGLDVNVAESVTVFGGNYNINSADGMQLTNIAAGGIWMDNLLAVTNTSDGIEIGNSTGTISLDYIDVSGNTRTGLHVNNAAAGNVELRDLLSVGNGLKGAEIIDVASVSDLYGHGALRTW